MTTEYEIKVKRDRDGIYVAGLWELRPSVLSTGAAVTLRKLVRERMSPELDTALYLAGEGYHVARVEGLETAPPPPATAPAPAPTRAQLLTEAAEKVEEVLRDLDLRRTDCKCCGAARWENFPDKKLGDRLEAFARGLRDAARGLS